MTALCDRTAKAAAIASIGEYPYCRDAATARPMRLLAKLRETEDSISVLRVRYRDRGCLRSASLAPAQELRKAERESDAVATEMGALDYINVEVLAVCPSTKYGDFRDEFSLLLEIFECYNRQLQR